jgi:hypothetical protein
MAGKQVIARMFFNNGHVETRPLSWIHFSTADGFQGKRAVFDEVVNDRIKTEQDEVYVAFTEHLCGIQLFLGDFVNARLERKSNYQHSN